MRFRIVAALSLLAALAPLGCHQQHSSSEHYYLVAGNLRLPYWKTLVSGFQDAAKQIGVTAEVRGPDNDDPQAEANEFDKAASENPAGILVSVIDASRLQPEINSAIQSGIPVITVDSDAPGSSRLYFIGTNNWTAGRAGAMRLAEALRGKGNVVFYSLAGQPNIEDRLKGYIDVLNGHAGIKVVDVYDIKADPQAAFDKTREYLHRTGKDKVDAFVCLDSASGKEVADAIAREHATDRTVISMDVNPDTLNLVKSGAIVATISQKPYSMGYIGLRALDGIHHNKPNSFLQSYQTDTKSPYPAFVDTGSTLVDSSNVDRFMTPTANGSNR